MALKKSALVLLLALASNSFGTRIQPVNDNMLKSILETRSGPFDCICIRKSHNLPVISNIVGFEKMKRIVIYLYKDLYSSKVKIYIPSAVKQAAIPDFVYEAGDKLEDLTSSFQIHDLFHSFDIPTFNIRTGRYEYTQESVVQFIPTTITDNVAIGGPGGIHGSFQHQTGGGHGGAVNGGIQGSFHHQTGNGHGGAINGGLHGSFHHQTGNGHGSAVNGGLHGSFQHQTGGGHGTVVDGGLHGSFKHKIGAGLGRIIKGGLHSRFQHHIGSSLPFFNIYTDLLKHDHSNSVTHSKKELSIFERWFHRHLGYMLGNVDTSILKKYLLRLLHKLGVKLVEGAQRSLYDISNIITYYATIDNALLYNETNNIRVNLPNPYLEVLVIALRHPPKVLGYLPIDPLITTQLKSFPSHVSAENHEQPKGHAKITKTFKILNEISIGRDGEGKDTNLQPGQEDEDSSEELSHSREHKFGKGHDKSEGPEGIDGDKDVDEQPGVRIVGGAAATGSGTPVTSRGRSGFDYYE